MNYWTKSRRISRRRLVQRGAAMAAGSAALGLGIGCGDDDDEGQPAPDATSAAEQQPKRGGTLPILNGIGEQPHHDVHQTSTGQLHTRGSGLVYSRLLRRKLGPNMQPGIDVIPEGDVAASWEQPDDHTYVFKLGPNIKWQNIAPVNGRAFTAEDVAYSAERQIQLRTNAAFLPGVRRIVAVDPATVRIELEKPDADFLATITTSQNKIVAREAVQVKGDLKEGPVIGSGPWILSRWVPNNTIEFTRNPDYFRPDFPYVDRLEIPRIRDASTALAAFRAKQVVAIEVKKDELDTLKRSNPEIQSREDRQTDPVSGPALIMRMDTPPVNDIRVRQAISKAIDRQVIMETVTSGFGWLGGALLSVTDTKDLLSEDELKKLLARDITASKRLLQEAGFQGWNVRQGSGNNPSFTAVSELVQAQIKEIGINTTLDLFDNVRVTNWFTKHDSEFVTYIRGAGVLGVNADLNGSYKTGGSRNVAKLSDPTIDRLIEQQALELKDKEKRRQLLHQIQRRIIELAAVTPIFSEITLTAYWPHVKNVWFRNTTFEPSSFEFMWIDR